MKGKHDDACKHKKCWEYDKYPQYNSNTKADLIKSRQDFICFKRVKKGKGGFLLALNPYDSDTAARSAFKKFERQSYLDTFGTWPSDRDIFYRSEVSIEFVQIAVFNYVQDPLTNERTKKWSIDVTEAAVYFSSL
jgi:hypothetical protein